MCVGKLAIYQCSICMDVAAKPETIAHRCADTPKNEEHCGFLKSYRPQASLQQARDLHPSHPDYVAEIRLEALEKKSGDVEANEYRMNRPKAFRCDLCVEHLGPVEAAARSKWARRELKKQLTMTKGGFLTGGYSVAGWQTTLR